MYEVCRVQKLSSTELAHFDDQFIDHLFEMVETTRDNQDERLNYSVIRLIVSYLICRQDSELTPGRSERAIHGINHSHQAYQDPSHGNDAWRSDVDRRAGQYEA
jgi:hypothetical protein